MTYQSGDFIGGKYRIIDVIGSGAMGIVYKAENVNMRKIVCLKVLTPEVAGDDNYLERFIREARAAATIEHSNICTINDFDIDHGANGDEHNPYIVMEYLCGQTLRKKIATCGAFHPVTAVRIMRQLLSALSSAHARGIVHRDVKPDNVMLIHRDGRDDFVKLIDFGIAHIESPLGDLKTLTQTGQIYGTPQYISPEQAQGDPVDFRADQYACGVIFYELLTGQPPFNSGNYIDLLIKQVNDPPPRLPSHLPQSSRIDAFIQKLLQKDPAKRFADTSETIPILDDILIRFSKGDGSESALRAHAMTISGDLSVIDDEDDEQPRTESIRYELIDALPKTKRQRQLFFMLTVVAAAVLLIIGLVLFLLIDRHVEGAHLAKIEKTAVANSIVEATPTPQIPLPPTSYDVDAVDFDIASDPILSQDNTLADAAKDFGDKNFGAVLKKLNEVKEKYWDHPNFVRLYVIAARENRDPSLAIKALERLIAIEPNATQNGDIRALVYAYFSSDDHFRAIKSAVYRNNNANTATNVAWLIVNSPYDQFPERLERLIDVYDFLPHAGVPAWLNDAVRVWKLPKDNCNARKTLLQEMTKDAQNDDFYAYVLEAFDRNRDKRCRGDKSDCNECLRSWLRETLEARNLREAPHEGEPVQP